MWGLMVPALSQKVANFYEFRSRFVSKVGFFLIFEPILQAGFFDKMFALSSKQSTFVLVSSSFCCCFFTILCLKYHLKGRLLTKKAPSATIITIFTVFPWFGAPGRLPIFEVFGGALIKTDENVDSPFPTHTRTLYIIYDN